jgi:hypothetical protein
MVENSTIYPEMLANQVVIPTNEEVACQSGHGTVVITGFEDNQISLIWFLPDVTIRTQKIDIAHCWILHPDLQEP